MNPPHVNPGPFRQFDLQRILAEDELIVAGKDGFPVSKGHKVIIPRQRVATLSEVSEAGQPVPHLHIHWIPRYGGDKEDPRGGVRWVLPDKAKYWA